MTVLQNVMFPMTVGKNKKPKDEAEKIAQKFMKLTHIEELADQNRAIFLVGNSSVFRLHVH